MKNISPDLLEKYLSGNCTHEEREIVERWFQQFENDADDLRLSEASERAHLDDKMLQEINRVIYTRTISKSKGSVPVRRFLSTSLYRVAVGIAAVVVMGLLVFYWAGPELNFTKSQPAFAKIGNTSEGITRHELMDGTLVWLRPNSHLEFPNRFSKDKRELKLVGEAFFDVAKDPSRPFIISTGNVTTKVLGTSFNIKAYDNASSIEVSVLTGKVSVDVATPSEHKKASATSVVLTPNQRVTYVKAKNTLEKEESKELPELSIWQSTDVVFDNVQLKQVISVLNKKFNVRIQTSNQNLLNCLIRADFTNQNLPDIMELLSKSVEATYEIENKTIFLSGEGCEP
jgi:ferric-dicitrate binding protein FerR (iron transport regulator)